MSGHSGDSGKSPEAPKTGMISDLRVLWSLVAHRGRGATHQERLESFYSGQAGDYDGFRKRLLRGRERMLEAADSTDPDATGGTWIDIGGGTGHNIEAAGPDARDRFDKIIVLDLTPSLLEVAKRRIDGQGWTNVETLLADATAFDLPPGCPPVRRVTFSYSLTMIPDWFAAIDRALGHLQPGGLCGVVDFYVARKYPEAGLARHPWSTRAGWPLWFANDNVFLNPDHIPYLRARLETKILEEHRAKVPYLPLVRVPYYVFIGRKA